MRHLLSLSVLLLSIAAVPADARGVRRGGPTLGDKSLGELVEILKTHPDAPHRAEAARQLGVWGMHKGDAESRKALLAAFEGDAEAKVRVSAAASLLSRGEPETFEPLLAALADPRTDADLRSHVAYSIHQFSDKRAVPVLLKTLEEPALRYESMHSLGELKAEEALEPIVRIVLEHVMHHGEQSDDPLAHTAEIAEGVRALGSIGRVEGLRAVGPVLAMDDPWRRKDAVEAIGAVAADKRTPQPLRDLILIPLLVHRLDPGEEGKADVRQQAVYSLAGLGGKEATAALQKTYLDDPSYRVRSAASDALVRMKQPCLDRRGRPGNCNVFQDIEKRIQDGTWDSPDRD